MWAGTIISNERVVKSEALGSYCPLACASCVNRALLDVMSSEDDLFSSNEVSEHNVLNVLLEVVGQSRACSTVSLETRNLQGHLSSVIWRWISLASRCKLLGSLRTAGRWETLC